MSSNIDNNITNKVAFRDGTKSGLDEIRAPAAYNTAVVREKGDNKIKVTVSSMDLATVLGLTAITRGGKTRLTYTSTSNLKDDQLENYQHQATIAYTRFNKWLKGETK